VTTPLVPPKRSTPLAVQISEQLRDRIGSGQWAVDQKIPSENELVSAFGASRNTVREAIRGLVHAGLLEPRAGDGTYVRARNELDVALARRASSEKVVEVFEVREALELHAVRLAASRVVPEDIEHLTALLDERDAAGRPEDSLAADLRFHEHVVALAGNALMTDLYVNLDRVKTYAPSGATGEVNAQLTGRWPEADPHRDIVTALQRHDADAAADAALRLLTHSREAFLHQSQA
jgi:DNA-binding FadR family transcriptional regulator